MSIFKKKQSPSLGITGVGFDDNGISTVRIVRAQHQPPALTLCEYNAYTDDDPVPLIRAISRDHGLAKSYCTTVLDSSDYKLQMVDAPKVPEDEMLSALRWRLNEVIDTPIEETSLDVFDAPKVASNEKNHSVYVVIAQDAAIQHRVNYLAEADVGLQVIDIVEMALRNVAGLMKDDDRGIALLWLRHQDGLLTLTREDELYLSRHLETGLDQIVDETQRSLALGKIISEIQRSLDYFEGNYRQQPVRKLVLAPLLVDVPGIAEHLQEQLGIEVVILDFEQHLKMNCAKAMPDNWQARQFITIGAALRQS